MSSKDNLQNLRPGTFRSSISRNLDGSSQNVTFVSREDLKKEIPNSDYFVYNQEGQGIHSTQQIPLDFSKFENHTFFNSAEVNVNVAFDNIINNYPFDGSRHDLEKYLNGLTGFEKHVLDKFPTNLGALILSGATTGSSTIGNYIEVKDFAGSNFTNFSSNKTGEGQLSLDKKSYSIEANLFIPPLKNSNEIICQKISGSNGFTLALSRSNSTSKTDVLFSVRSGSVMLITSASLDKNKFNNICAVYDKSNDNGRLKIFVGSKLVGTSSSTAIFENIDFNRSSFFIGSGTRHSGILHDDMDFLPMATLSGSIDEVRVFKNARLEPQIKANMKRNIFATDDLALYFKFNEPSASFGDNSIVLDSSGKSLHSRISNYAVACRQTSSLSLPLTSEERKYNPVLFPKYQELVDLNVDLLTSASAYDTKNPNLITRLIPQHYLKDGQDFFAFSDVDGDITLPYSGSSIPGTGELGSAQILSSLLFVWAKHFDELKISTDQFSQLLNPDYTSSEGMSDVFIKFLMNHYGFDEPPILTDANPDQYFHGENVKNSYVNIEESLQSIRNKILRRILVNIQDIIKSKGTVQGIKSAFRSMGFDPDILFRIKEYGGPRKFSLSELRSKRAIIQPMLDFSGGYVGRNQSSLDATGFSSICPHFQTSYFSGSRKEVGYPDPQGTLILKNTTAGGYHGVSNNASDGLFTSGSWTYEGTYRFPMSGNFLLTQSAARLHVTGNSAPASGQGVLANLLVMSGTTEEGKESKSSVKLFVRAATTAYTRAEWKPFELVLTGVNVMDGDKWSLSFGRTRNDQAKSLMSSSYFLRCAKQSEGVITNIHTTSSFYKEDPAGSPSNIAFQKMSTTLNASGAFVVIGSQSLNRDANYFLNNTDMTDQMQVTDFGGQVAQIRFWSKSLLENEWKEHVRNPTSVGTENPATNFNFNEISSGSFERLRADISIDQPISSSNSSGKIILTDFTQNKLFGTGSAFELSKVLFDYEKVIFSSVSPSFDSGESSVKIRPRSFVSASNIEEFNSSPAPLYEILPNDEPTDDPRFSIDFSVANALNEDIVTIFSTLDEIDSVIGEANLQFALDYPGLQNLRNIYFQKLDKKVNFKNFLEFFRWFDKSVGTFVEQLVPKKTNFLGVNFVIEPHSLERAKVQYQFDGQYIGEEFRSDLKGIILLQQIAGGLRKF